MTSSSSHQSDQSLPRSRQPEIIRLHNLEESERGRFNSQFLTTLNELSPSILRHKLFSHPCMRSLIPDLYFTFTTVCASRRRLSEEYCYVTMYKDTHYWEEGVLVNKNMRTIVFLMEIIGRNLMPHLMNKAVQKLKRGTGQNSFGFIEVLLNSIDSGEELITNLKWILMMLFMLKATKSPNFIDNLLGLEYIYTFFNKNQTKISYKVEGILLLVALLIKLITFVFDVVNYSKVRNKKMVRKEDSIKKEDQQSAISQPGVVGRQKEQSQELCRICYCEIESKSCTKCGHCFCWGCIIQSLEYSLECPVCRTKCFPREVIQLRNL